MSVFTFIDSRGIVVDLVQYRWEAVGDLSFGEVFQRELADLVSEFAATRQQARTAVIRDPVPELYKRHVEVVNAFAAVLDGQRLDPDQPDAIREAADRLYIKVVDSSREMGRTALARGNFVTDIQDEFGSYAADLALLPPSATRLLRKWMVIGSELQQAMSERARPKHRNVRSPLELVQATAALLAKMRRAARVEIESRPDLDEAFEAELLGFADEQAAKRARARTPVVAESEAETPPTREPERVIVDVNVDVDVGSAPPTDAEPEPAQPAPTEDQATA